MTLLTPEQFAAAQKANFETLFGLTTKDGDCFSTDAMKKASQMRGFFCLRRSSSQPAKPAAATEHFRCPDRQRPRW